MTSAPPSPPHARPAAAAPLVFIVEDDEAVARLQARVGRQRSFQVGLLVAAVSAAACAFAVTLGGVGVDIAEAEHGGQHVGAADVRRRLQALRPFGLVSFDSSGTGGGDAARRSSLPPSRQEGRDR